jgi:hypothetical protein
VILHTNTQGRIKQPLRRRRGIGALKLPPAVTLAAVEAAQSALEDFVGTVRTHLGRLSTLSNFHSKFSSYGVFFYGCGGRLTV